MHRLSLLCLVLAAAIVGCGDSSSNTANSGAASGNSSVGDNNTTGTSEPSSASSAGDARAQNATSAVLIDLGDLPAKAKKSKPLPLAFCDPLEILDTSASQAAKSPMFAVGQIKLQEAVGIFPAIGLAKDAYDALLSASRVQCIKETIIFQGGVSVDTRSPIGMNVGDEAQSMIFEVEHLDTGEQNSVEVASVRSGSSAASLIFLNPTETPTTQLMRDVVDTAADRLAPDESDG